MHDALVIVLHVFFCPTDKYLVGGFYAAWMIVFMIFNIGWDVRSKFTPPFHLSRLRDKYPPVHSAAIFSSSLLLVLAAFQKDVAVAVGETVVPLLIVGFAGIFYGLAGLCPYEVPHVHGHS